MLHKLQLTYLLAQIIFAAAVIIFATAYAIRSLIRGQLIYAVCFAITAYICGYRLMLTSSIHEYRQLKNKA